MAIDLDAIRRKLAAVTGRGQTNAWKPEEGKTYNVRIVPFPDNDGIPISERQMYFNIAPYGFLAPYQFQLPDPISDFRRELYKNGSEDEKKVAKKLGAKMRGYAAVVVRGEEDKGVRQWSFGKNVYSGLMDLMLDEDYGDITDPQTGRDIKVEIRKDPLKSFSDTILTARVNTSPLSKDNAQAAKWLEEAGKLKPDGVDKCKTAEEIKKILDDWLNSGAGDKEDAGTERSGSDKGSQKIAELEELDTAPPVSQKKQKASKPKPAEDDIDAAFEDIT